MLKELLGENNIEPEEIDINKRKGVSKAIYLNLTKKEKNKAVHDKIPAVIKISK